MLICHNNPRNQHGKQYNCRNHKGCWDADNRRSYLLSNHSEDKSGTEDVMLYKYYVFLLSHYIGCQSFENFKDFFFFFTKDDFGKSIVIPVLEKGRTCFSNMYRFIVLEGILNVLYSTFIHMSFIKLAVSWNDLLQVKEPTSWASHRSQVSRLLLTCSLYVTKYLEDNTNKTHTNTHTHTQTPTYLHPNQFELFLKL